MYDNCGAINQKRNQFNKFPGGTCVTQIEVYHEEKLVRITENTTIGSTAKSVTLNSAMSVEDNSLSIYILPHYWMNS